jgi:hypothetical protein
MNFRRTSLFGFPLLALALLLPQGSTANDALNGTGWVRGRIVSERSVVINDAVYLVTPRSVLRGLDGRRSGFEELIDVVKVDSLERAPERVATWARYDATEVRGQLVLNWLELSNEYEGADAGGGSEHR